MLDQEIGHRLLQLILGLSKPRKGTQLFVIIILHSLIWVLFFFLPPFLYNVEVIVDQFLYKNLLNKLFLVGLFYLHYNFLIPRFFVKKHGRRYIGSIFLLLVVLFLQELLVEKYVLHQFPLNRSKVIPFPSAEGNFILGLPKEIVFIIFSNVLYSSWMLLLIGICIHMTFSFFQHQEEKRALENAKLNAEITSLKAQINPHFLFNTLNSVYVQAYRGATQTASSILKLSDIFQYVIYDSNEEKVLLEKDLQYITNYISLQRLRIASLVTIDYTVKGATNKMYIAPLLLITFIENAFKYGVSYKEPSSIIISIQIVEDMLTLYIKNPVTIRDEINYTGIGLVNAKRRLELLYPNKYFLDIQESGKEYIVNLELKLL